MQGKTRYFSLLNQGTNLRHIMDVRSYFCFSVFQELKHENSLSAATTQSHPVQSQTLNANKLPKPQCLGARRGLQDLRSPRLLGSFQLSDLHKNIIPALHKCLLEKGRIVLINSNLPKLKNLRRLIPTGSFRKLGIS